MKRIVLIIALLGVFGIAGATVFGVTRANQSKAVFDQDGYVLLGNDSVDAKHEEVTQGTSYSPTVAGTISFKNAAGDPVSAPEESFIAYKDNSVSAFKDGIILDFNDMSGNFINNYVVPSGMKIVRNGSDYYAYTTNGEINFGEHIWKLQDNKYLVCSPNLTVHFSDTDIRPAEEYVQVFVADDGVVRLLTPENIWTTLSSDCYIRTEGGVIITPVLQRVEDENYKLSLASLSVGADDAIILTEDETRRQIVPQIKVNTIDGADGETGDDGISGITGENGTNGTDGRAGINGVDGENGNAGSEGNAGSSGSSGSAGSSGTNGQNGAEGLRGEGSQSDAAIAVKYNGVDGADGIAGNAGASGDDGTPGGGGDPGPIGDEGEDGDGGGNGSNGDPGDPGGGGDDGDPGDPGDIGDPGGQGKDGRDADSTTSLKSQIPVITITDWQVYSTGVRGGIHVQDPSGFFKEVEGKETHPAYVTITDRNTGEVIYCYSYGTDKSYTSTSRGETNFFKDINDPTGSHDKTFYFSMDPEASTRLLPDTAYLLNVSAYYSVGETVYRRNFVTRSFYTDSSGVTLSLEDLQLDSVQVKDTSGVEEVTWTEYFGRATINVNKVDNSVSKVTTAEIYLLTEEQNRNFSLTKNTNYVYKYKVVYDDTNGSKSGTSGTKGEGYPQVHLDPADQASVPLLYVPVKASLLKDDKRGLDTNTNYIARVVVTTDYAGTLGVVLSPQELEFTTLKRRPTWDETLVPTVIYNRANGNFEVTRPVVTDPDESVVEYTYTPIQRLGTTGEWVELTGKAKTTIPGVPDPVSFDLPTQDSDGQLYYYKFKVDIETFDNEKTVNYTMGSSTEIHAEGSRLPTFKFTPTVEEFNYEKGTLHVILDQDSALTVSETMPLVLTIYGDEYYENTVVITDLKNGDCGVRSSAQMTCSKADEHGHCSCSECSKTCTCGCDWWINGYQDNYDANNTTNDFAIDIALAELYMDQKYTVIVNGSLNVGRDTSGNLIYADRELGSFAFRTKKIGTVTATWTENTTGSDPLNVKLKLAGSSDYETSELKKGQVTLQLYEGKGDNKKKLATRLLHDEADLAALYGDGYEVRQTTFNMTLTLGTEYTVEVLCVQDGTYAINGVKDIYDNKTFAIVNNTKIIQAKKTPPDLPDDPSTALTVKPILNKNAGSYGETKDEDLSDNAVIGYEIQATYDNVSELAYRVRYYAFEFTDFWDFVKQGKDPVGNYLTATGEDIVNSVGAKKLAIWTRNFETTQSKPTKVVVIFSDHTTSDTDADTSRGYAKYYISPMTGAAGNRTGMSRGYRYIFAYTVEYNNGSSQSVYPYGNEAEYQYAVANYGIGEMKLNNKGTVRGKGLAYVLNSGIKEAPKGDPEFHTYLAHIDSMELVKIDSRTDSVLNTATKGTAVLRYYYTDADNTIDPNDEGNITYKYRAVEDNKMVTRDGSETISKDEKTWNELSLTYTREIGGTADIVPLVKFNRYLINYNEGVLGNTYEGEGGDDEAWKLVDDPLNTSMGSFLGDYDWAGIIQKNNQTLNPDNPVPSVSWLRIQNDINKITFYYDLGTADNSLPKRIMEHAFMAQITAKETATGKTQTFLLPIQGDTTGYTNLDTGESACYSTMPTSRLGEGGAQTGDYSFTVKLIYDSGYQGWDLLDPDAKNSKSDSVYAEQGFGLYYYEKLVSGALSPGKYYTRYNTPTALPFAGLFEKSAEKVDFSKNLQAEPERIPTGYHYQATSADNVFSRYLYTAEKGVDYKGETPVLGQLDSNILIPKKAVSTDAKFKRTSSGEISVILPVVHWQNYDALSASVALVKENEDDNGNTQKFYVSGLNTAKSFNRDDSEVLKTQAADLSAKYYVLHAELFEQDREADSKLDSKIGTGLAGIRQLHIILDDKGEIYGTCTYDGDGKIATVTKTIKNETSKEWENLPVIGDDLLDVETAYYMSMYMEFEEKVSGGGTKTVKHVIMREDDEKKDEKSSYLVMTAAQVEVNLTGFDYDSKNISYFTKGITFQFNLKPRAYGLKMRYAIYDASLYTEQQVKDHKDLMDTSVVPRINFLTSPGSAYIDANYLKTTGNKVNIVLDPARLLADVGVVPDAPMQNLIPGKTYYLRIGAYNKTGVQQGEAWVEKFTIPYTVITAGITLGQTRRYDKVSYKVQVRDIRHLTMGYHYDSTDPTSIDLDEGSAVRKYNDEGMYAVRFTDADGKRIYTVYDDYVFSFQDTMNEFVLSDETQKTGKKVTLNPSTYYYCNIYVVKDLDLDGKSGTASKADQEPVQEDWKYFFKNLKVVKNPYTVEGEPVEIGYQVTDGFNALINTLWDETTGNPKEGAQLDPDGYYAKVRKQFLLESKSKKTTPAEGYIGIDKENVSFSAASGSFTFQATETSGVVTLNDDEEQVQGFDKIEWTIIREDNGQVFDGIALKANDDPMFVGTLSGGRLTGTVRYEMNLGDGVSITPGVNYLISLKLTKNKVDDTLPEQVFEYSDRINKNN